MLKYVLEKPLRFPLKRFGIQRWNTQTTKSYKKRLAKIKIFLAVNLLSFLKGLSQVRK